MASHAISHPAGSRLAPVIQITAFCDSSRKFTKEHLPSNCVIEMESRASAAGLGCVRGMTIALLFEAAAAVVIYGGWQLWHLLQR